MKAKELIEKLQKIQDGRDDELEVIFEVGDDAVASHSTTVRASRMCNAVYIDLNCRIRTEVET